LATVTPAQPSPEGPPAATATPSHVQAQVQAQIQAVKDQQHTGATPDDGVDTSSLPPVQAPPSHPDIDPSATGVFDGRSILELDLNAMADKPWRRPGSDISDWFNYGFDELSWEAYCYRRRDLGEMANVLKTNVIVRALSAYFYLCHPFIIPSFLAMCIELRSDARGTTNRPTA
jgi:pre-mRNA 3'-end-processing factor FIP1